MIVRLALLVAVLLMPFGMTAAPASAPHHRVAADMPMGHCPDQAPAHGMKGGIAECTMACAAALPAIGRQADESDLIVREPVQPVAVQRLHGLHPETATPPPKTA